MKFLRRHRLASALAVLLAIWAVLAALAVLSAYQNATDGLAAIDDLGSLATNDLSTFVDSIGGDTDDIPEETAAAQLSLASEEFRSARADLDSWVLAPLRVAPVLGRQMRSAQALARAAEITAESGSVAFAELNAELEGTAQSPEARLETARTTERVLTELRSALDGIDAGPTQKLLPPLARARNRFSDEYAQTLETLDSALVTIEGVNDFLTGPNRYLVLASNNAEMRAGSGMFLQVGELTVENGRFEIGEFTPSGQLLLDGPGTALDADMSHLWDWLDPDREWRNLNLSPRFDESARMASEMWVAAGNEPVDGVISLDVIGVAELLDIIGPVEIEAESGSVEVSSENVVDYLLLEQYQDFVDDRDARRDQLGQVSASIFDAFNSRTWSASGLMRALQRSGEGRHVLLWSSDETQQAAWEELGADGVLTPRSLMVSILNRGGNKLDQFLEVEADLTSEVVGDMREMTLEMTLGNVAPRTLPLYVEGPHPNTGLDEGDYLGIVAVTLPAGAGNIEMTGARLSISGDDGATRVAGGEILIPFGGTAKVRVDFELPTDWETLEIAPSARVPPITWTAGDAEWTDETPVELPLDDV